MMSLQGKLRRVTDLVEKLCKDQESGNLPPQERQDALLQLKLEGRDPRGADPIFTEKGISMLLKYTFDSTDLETSRGAQRVLANSMVLNPSTRQLVAGQNSAPRFCDLLERTAFDDEFLSCRILFLITYTNPDLNDLIENHHLAQHIVKHLEQHKERLSQDTKPDPMEDMALTEILKLMFNVLHFCPSQAKEFSPAVPHLAALLWRGDIPEARPLDGIYGPLANALMSIDYDDEKAQAGIFLADEPDKVLARLVQLLDRAIRTYQDNDLEVSVTPLISLLWKIYESAPEDRKQFLRESLLPTAEDREKVLGRGETLSAKLLSNFSNPMCPKLRDAISGFLFDMSDKDASKFVENVGYGLASGYLFQRNIPVPASASDTNAASGSSSERPINPITGQFIDAETEVELPEMTDEEKEREAERLFVLFERLKATGVMDVQNPVEAAMREGRYRELKDDEVEELD